MTKIRVTFTNREYVDMNVKAAVVKQDTETLDIVHNDESLEIVNWNKILSFRIYKDPQYKI